MEVSPCSSAEDLSILGLRLASIDLEDIAETLRLSPDVIVERIQSLLTAVGARGGEVPGRDGRNWAAK